MSETLRSLSPPFVLCIAQLSFIVRAGEQTTRQSVICVTGAPFTSKVVTTELKTPERLAKFPKPPQVTWSAGNSICGNHLLKKEQYESKPGSFLSAFSAL